MELGRNKDGSIYDVLYVGDAIIVATVAEAVVTEIVAVEAMAVATRSLSFTKKGSRLVEGTGKGGPGVNRPIDEFDDTDIYKGAAKSRAAEGTGNSLTSKSVGDLPSNVQNSFNQYDNKGWKGNVPGQTKGTKAGGTYENNNGALPTTDSAGNPITYREFDVNNKAQGATRDAERFIQGSDGSVYYTDSHYGDIVSPSGLPSFVKLK